MKNDENGIQIYLENRNRLHNIMLFVGIKSNSYWCVKNTDKKMSGVKLSRSTPNRWSSHSSWVLTDLQHTALCQRSPVRRDKRRTGGGAVGLGWAVHLLCYCPLWGGGAGAHRKKEKSSNPKLCVYVCMCVCVCVFSAVCKANGEAYNPVRGKGGRGGGCLGECFAPSSTAGWLTGHWTPFPSSHLHTPLHPPLLPPIQHRQITRQGITQVKRQNTINVIIYSISYLGANENF